MLVLLFGFLVFQFYSASIVGSLLMEKPKTIKTLRNLIDSPLDAGIEDIVYNKDFFNVSTLLASGVCCCFMSIFSSFIRSYAPTLLNIISDYYRSNKQVKNTQKKTDSIKSLCTRTYNLYGGAFAFSISQF